METLILHHDVISKFPKAMHELLKTIHNTKKRHVANLGIWLNQRPREAFQKKEPRHSWWQPLVQVRWRTSSLGTQQA
jgi:hypothetical protein